MGILLFDWSKVILFCCLVFSVVGRSFPGSQTSWVVEQQQPLQDIVTWDEHSLFVHGKRIMVFSGEFHPFRLPVPGLWLDVFQKMRSMGYTGVSFYVDWALLEGKPGNFSASGVFALEPFFEAAKKAGIYLIARPGPYINAEASGGGFPGWTQRLPGILRTTDKSYLKATELYVKSIGTIIAKAQITNGGPVILLQPENEYTGATKDVKFPDENYMNYVYQQYRKAGIVVPFISNDASPSGHNAPGQPAAVDIYGHDGYPLSWNCAKPTYWPQGHFPSNWRDAHLRQSPATPYTIPEFQGGSFDPWGGAGYDKCAELMNSEAERVLYKNDFSFGVTIFNIYMTYGGTNWGNLGHPGGYTSYDYGAAITEDRLVSREKYSEAKLQANFLAASPAYLSAIPGQINHDAIVGTDRIVSTTLRSEPTKFIIVRHENWTSTESTDYALMIESERIGKGSVPRFEMPLSLNGRDSKIHVVDYDIGGINLAYCTAEIFTWQKYPSTNKTVLVVYGGPDEHHEMAISMTLDRDPPPYLNGLLVQSRMSKTTINWMTNPIDRYFDLNNITIYFLERNSAYKYWVIPMPNDSSNRSLYTGTYNTSAIIKGPYLVRTALVEGDSMAITGDINATTTMRILGGAPRKLAKLTFNGQSLKFTQNKVGIVVANITYNKPEIKIPNLREAEWRVIDSLPEIQSNYSDDSWTPANLTKTYNTKAKQKTPTSLFASDYGYNLGYILFRGHFQATGVEKSLQLVTRGGSAFGASAWLDDTFIGSFTGYDAAEKGTSTFALPNVASGQKYVITVVLDNMGHDEDWTVGTDQSKNPIGILDYTLSGREKEAITWKLTGNLGGEDYIDQARGPHNEGGLWAERNGYHLPNAPSKDWSSSKGPTKGITKAGVAWYTTSFELNMPKGYDIPLSVQFSNTSTSLSTGSKAVAFRVQLYVNGWQFGKYVNNIGPQTRFPVPEGIWSYRGKNWVSVSLWSLEDKGAKLEDIQLVAGPIIQSGMEEVKLVDSPKWKRRLGAY